jgi:putative Holliday junction resolvase
MRVLGLDLGSRTIGIAISDSLGIIASGVETYRFDDDRYDLALNRVIEIVKEKKVDKIVLGYPKHMNGDIGDKAKLCEDFKVKLEESLKIEVILMDERWTTKLANNRLLEADISRKKRKKVIDKMAAVVILQDYLDSKGGYYNG